MKRIALGLMLGALIFGVAFAGAKVATVTNPMSGNLDGGGYTITNISELQVLDALDANGLHLIGGMPATPLSLLAGYIDPTCCPALSAQPGSLYLRRADDTHGELWLKTGANAGEWTRVAGTP